MKHQCVGERERERERERESLPNSCWIHLYRWILNILKFGWSVLIQL